MKYEFDNSSFIKCIKDKSIPNYDCHTQDSKVLVIGFCETATALGLSVASSIEGSTFISTTREPIYNVSQLVTFEEAHSHASTHYMYSNEIKLSNFKKLILVDDEITTGNSLLHLMETLLKNSNIEDISIMTILDWRNDEQILKFKEFALSHKVNINVYSLVSGVIIEEDSNIYHNPSINIIDESISSIDLSIFNKTEIHFPNDKKISYLTDSGRFGITYNQIISIEEKAKKAALSISEYIKDNSRILVLGHGENIYIPSRIAAYLDNLGYDVTFKTTSRTPIYCDGILFEDVQTFYDNGNKYHFYNRNEAEKNDTVIMLSENNFTSKLCNNMMIFNL